MLIKYKLLTTTAKAPIYKTAGASCGDLTADADIRIPAYKSVAIPTGVAFEIPEGAEGEIRPRSGLSLEMPVIIVQGTIDSDYRGEVKIIVRNLDRESVLIRRGDRIAQIKFAPTEQPALELVTELTKTARGANGFGHTGRRG